MPDDQRMQPEFSEGERIRGIESDLAALDRRFEEVRELFNEKLGGLRRELGVVNEAQKASVEKSENAQQRQFNTFVEANDRKAEVTGQRIAALERQEAAGEGERRYKASQVAWIGAAAAFATVLIYSILVFHP